MTIEFLDCDTVELGLPVFGYLVFVLFLKLAPAPCTFNSAICLVAKHHLDETFQDPSASVMLALQVDCIRSRIVLAKLRPSERSAPCKSGSTRDDFGFSNHIA